jgi:hypothetical protein
MVGQPEGTRLVHFSIRRLWWAGPLVTLLALAAELFFYWITQVLGERYFLTLGGPSHPAGLMPVSLIVIPTAVVSLGASLLFALLLRFSRTPLPPFLSIAAMALLVSFGAPFSLTGETTLTTKLLLVAMQILGSLVIVLGLLILARTS